MAMEPQPPVVRISDVERQRAAELLQHACGEGRLNLEEFSLRLGAVWAADTSAELEHAVADLAPVPTVGGLIIEEKIVTVFSESKRRGRWRLRAKLREGNAFGATELDL